MKNTDQMENLDQNLALADVATMVAELIIQTKLATHMTSYTFSPEALNGMAFLYGRIGGACRELEELYKKVHNEGS